MIRVCAIAALVVTFLAGCGDELPGMAQPDGAALPGPGGQPGNMTGGPMLPGANGGTRDGWTCSDGPSGIWTCSTTDCTQSGCSNGTAPRPPGSPPFSSWSCVTSTLGSICTSTPPPGSASCRQPGIERWCDGDMSSAWGKQTCAIQNGVYKWGPCVESDPAHPTPGPATQCACYFPRSYNPACCEDPATCKVVSSRNLPCDGPPGGQCAPCGDDRGCASPLLCARMQHEVKDTAGNGKHMNVVEQFCAKTCKMDGDCGAGYKCPKKSSSSVRLCIPVNGTCL